MPGTWESPFAATSIWYQQIGSGAVYVAANIPTVQDIFNEQDVLVGTPTAPLRAVYSNDAGWGYTNPPDSGGFV